MRINTIRKGDRTILQASGETADLNRLKFFDIFKGKKIKTEVV